MYLHRGSKLLWNLYLKLKLFWFLFEQSIFFLLFLYILIKNNIKILIFMINLPLIAMFQHTSPCPCNYWSRSASRKACCSINTSIPNCVYIKLVISQFFFSKHQKRTSFGSESIFMWITTDWCDSWNCERAIIFLFKA